MELATLALFNKVKVGFSGTGGVARQFVGDMSKLATDFFMDTRMYEAQLDSADASIRFVYLRLSHNQCILR